MSKFSQVIPSRSDLDWCWYLRKQGAVGDWLERVLHDIGVLQPGGWAPWNDSRLTGTGALTEVIFSSDCDVMSLRTEVDDPGKDPHGRVARVCAIMDDLGQMPPPAALRAALSAAQDGSKLRYGAWLGLDMCGRHRAAVLYAELPRQAADLAGLVSSAEVAECLAVLGANISVHMLSFNSATRDTTIFCQTSRAAASVLPVLAQHANVPLGPLQSAIKTLMAAGDLSADAVPALGFSFTMPQQGGTPVLTLRCAAKDITVSDDVLAKWVRDYPGDHRPAYAALSDMLLPAPEGQMHHGTISLKARTAGVPLLSVGVAAPWVCPFYPV